MRIGSLGFSTFVYNTNMISSNSLSKVSSIGNDLTAAKTDFSYLTDDSLNVNPLGRGESASFFEILEMQMQMSRGNASRLMPQEDAFGTEPVQNAQETAQEDVAPVEFAGNEDVEEILSMQYDRNLYQMQKAAEAYRVQSL